MTKRLDPIGFTDQLRFLDHIDSCAGLVGIYDETETVRFCNEAFREAYFIEPGEVLNWSTLMRRNFEARRGTVIETDDIDSWIASVRSRRGKSRYRRYESDLHDGRWIWVTETLQPDGWIVYFGADVTQLNQTERQLRHARDIALRESQTDALTGVSSRSHILCHMQTMIDAASQTGSPSGFACLMDIDHFKAINDTHGHPVGDRVLTAFAQRVRQAVRLRDGFGRVGGEEFLLLLPDVAASEARIILEDVASIVQRDPLVPEVPTLRVTFSAGLFPITSGCVLTSTYARADQALYRAKMAGRNRIVLES